MLIGITEEPVVAQPWRKKRLHELKCDLPGCENSWRVPFRDNRPEDKLDFCCSDHKYAARRRGEIFDKKLKKLSLKKWGVPSPNCLKEVQQKSSQTKEARWGDSNYNNRQKAEQTCQEKLGCSNPFQSEPVKEKIRVSMLERWGVESPIHSPEIKGKIENSLLQNWGVTHSWNKPEHRARNKSRQVREKIHQTMKARGLYGKSKIEDRMFDDLCHLYGPENVERQVSLNGWSIDFRVRGIYIQLDGAYWHGLDRTVEELMHSKNPRDKVILGTVRRDAEQNEWCCTSGTKMIRVTDREYKSAGIAVIVDKMKEFD